MATRRKTEFKKSNQLGVVLYVKLAFKIKRSQIQLSFSYNENWIITLQEFPLETFQVSSFLLFNTKHLSFQ